MSVNSLRYHYLVPLAPTIDSVRLDGYSILADTFSSGDIDRIAEAISKSTLPRTRAGIRHLLHDPIITGLARDPRLMHIARSTLGDSAFPFRATLFDKSPDSNWFVIWHQDTALPLAEKRDLPGWGPWSIKDGIHYAHAPASALEQVLAIRIHLDNSTAHNGPLRLLPGTHNRGVLTDDEVHQLSLDVAPIDCLVPRGGLILMRPLIVHASSKSRNDLSRRVLHIEYAAQTSFDGLALALA